MAGGYLFGWLEGCCSAKNINPMRDEALQMEENVEDRLRRRSDGVQRIDPAPPKSPHVIQGEAGGSARFSPRVVGTDAEKVGLGIAFQQMVSLHHDSRPKLAVKSLAFDSPAFNSRQIKEGDVLLSINGRSVRGMTGAEIAPFILGPQGSWVELSFERSAADGETSHSEAAKVVNVRLQRRWNRVSSP